LPARRGRLAEYAPSDVPVIIENVVTDIDTIVRQVRFTGWSQTQNGDRTVRREIRLVLKKYALPSDVLGRDAAEVPPAQDRHVI